MAGSNRARLLKGGLGGISGLSVRIILQLLQVPVLYSAWNVNLASTWLVLWTLPSYMTITVASFSSAGGNLAVAAKNAGDVGGVRAAYRATLRCIVISNVLMVGFILALSPFMINRDNLAISGSDLWQTIALLGVYVLVRVQSSTQDLVYRYGEEYGAYNMIESFTSLAELMVTAVVVNVTQHMMVLPLCLAVLRVAVYAAINVHARRRWPEVFGRADPELIARSFRRMLMPFVGFLAMPALYAVNLQGYSLLINNAFGPVLFSTFLTMRTLTRMVDQICAASGKVLFYEFAYIDISAKKAAAIGISGMVVLVQAAIGIAYAAGLLLFGEPIHHLWTAGRVAFSPELVVVFGLAGVLRAIADPMYAILSARNAHTATTTIYFMCSVLSLGVGWVMATHGAGLIAIASCVVFAELSNLVAGYYFASRMFEMPVPRFALSVGRLGIGQIRQMTMGIARRL